MKKILILSLVLGVMLAVAGVVTAKNQEQKLGLPKNAVEVSPGVFYLGKSMDKGKVVEGYAFVHYAKDSKQAKAAKPVVDDTVDIYKLMFGGIKWANTMTYEVNTDGSGSDLGEDGVMAVLSASLETWDEQTSFDLFAVPNLNNSVSFNSNMDQINTVTWGDLSSGIIAVNAFWFNIRTKEIVESDVVFNSYYAWIDCTAVICINKMDLQNIATHEFGHNGLNDLYIPKTAELTMYGYGDYGETDKRTLGTGDKSGIQALYGI